MSKVDGAIGVGDDCWRDGGKWSSSRLDEVGGRRRIAKCVGCVRDTEICGELVSAQKA